MSRAESDGESSSDGGGEGDVEGAVQQALNALTGLDEPDDLEAAMHEASDASKLPAPRAPPLARAQQRESCAVRSPDRRGLAVYVCVCLCVCTRARAHAREQLKKQVLTVQYMASLNKIVANILGYDGSVEAPFPKADRNALADLFQRCSVVQHSVFKDNEWTLGPRREPCGANTTLEMVDKKGAMSATIVFEWYWRNDEDEVSSPARCCSGRHSVRRRTPGRVHTHTHAHARTHTHTHTHTHTNARRDSSKTTL